MTDIYNDEYWSTQFDITQDDLNRIAERMERDGAPQDLKTIALRIVKGRLEYGHDPSPSALAKLTGKASVRLWDPAGEWQIGDLILIATCRRNSSKHEAFLGEIVNAGYCKKGEHDTRVHIKIDELNEEKDFILASPGSQQAQDWYRTVREAVEKKLQSGNIDQQTEGILLRHGEHILSRLTEAFQDETRFIGLGGKWYVKSKLPRMSDDNQRAIHHTLLEKPSALIDELLPIIDFGQAQDETLTRMAVNVTLQEAPTRFKNIGTTSRPQWQAQPPSPENAVVTHYAYDPQTYEILSRPGQRLTKKQAKRLQELNIYVHVVTFAE
jgi:hypothetical protein